MIQMKFDKKILVCATLLVVGLVFLSPNIIEPLSMFFDQVNYLIVVEDSYYNNPLLLQFVSRKISEGYNVKLTNLTEAINSVIPQLGGGSGTPMGITYFPAIPVKMKRVENIVMTGVMADYTTINVLWRDGSHYDTIATKTGNVFKVKSVPSEPKNIYIYKEDFLNDLHVTIIYDGNQTISFSANGYINYGQRYLCKRDTYAFLMANYTEASAVHDYIGSFHSLQYALLIGNIPSYEFRYTMGTDRSQVYKALTDNILGVRDLYGNKNLIPDIAIGRLPIKSVTELENTLTKTMNYVPNINKRSVLMLGEGTPIDYFRSMTATVKQNLQNVYPEDVVRNVTYPTVNQVVSEVNLENDHIVLYAHGSPSTIFMGSGINKVTIQSLIKFYNPSLVFAASCSTADFSYSDRCVGEYFMIDQNNRVVTYIGGTAILWSSNTICQNFYNNLATLKTIGKMLNQAKISPVFTDRLAFVIFGDPSLKLINDEVIPESYGTLDIVSTDFLAVTFPNSTIKNYANSTTIYNCPEGGYIVNNEHVIFVEPNKVSTVTIYQGNSRLQITSNCHVAINVTAMNNDFSVIKFAPFELINIPSGSYQIFVIDDFNNVLFKKAITIVDGETATLSLNLDLYGSSADIVYAARTMLGFIFVALGSIGLILKKIKKW